MFRALPDCARKNATTRNPEQHERRPDDATTADFIDTNSSSDCAAVDASTGNHNSFPTG
jgi:hypothetical protein